MVDKKLLLFAALLLAACTTDPLNETSGSKVQTNSSAKIINTSTNAGKGTLLVNFKNEAVEQIETIVASAAKTRAAVTRSGILNIDQILEELDASSLQRVFPVDQRNEARTRAAGLHQWYIIHFDEGANLDEAAAKLATVSEVQTVQFNTQFKQTDDYKAVPMGKSAAPTATIAGTFNDPQLSKQWHYINTGDKSYGAKARVGADINVKEAWKLTGGDPSVIVAIVDEGVKYSHPDLAANMWVNTRELNGVAGVDDDGNGYVDDIYGYNFAARGAVSWDKPVIVNGENDGDSGHGTHVAGTVAAVNNNNIGVCGVAGGTGRNDGVKLMSCQIFSGYNVGNSGSSAASASAIKYAADNGASIIQCSFGSAAGAITSDNDFAARGGGIQKQAIDYFMSTKNSSVIDGGLVIFAAGNDGVGMSGYPGAYRDYVSVTSFAPDYLPAYYTNYGPACNIAAPGGEYTLAPDQTRSMVLSTVPSELYAGDDYGYMQGTSMACPHVSGVAALGLSYAVKQGKKYTTNEFKSMLLTAVTNIDELLDGVKESRKTLNLADYRKKMGTGATDAYQLLMQIEGTPCLKAKVGVKQVIAITKYFGGGAANLTYQKVEMSTEAKAALGVTEDPVIAYGKLQIKCTKPGVAKIKITAVGGGENIGTGTVMGGIPITKEFAIIARATTNGGWL